MNLVYNIWFDVAAIIITIVTICVLFFQYSDSTLPNKLYRVFTVSLFLTETLDLVTAFTISYSSSFPIWLNIFLNSMFFMMNTITLALFNYYVLSSLKKEKVTKIFNNINVPLAFIESIILVINSFTGISFSFAGGIYKHGPLFRLNYVFPLLLMLEIIILLILYGKKMNRKQLVSNLLLVILMIIAISLQNFLCPDYLLSMFAASITALYTLFTLETPDYQELEYLRKNLENEVIKQTEIVKEQENKINKMNLEVIMALVESIDAKDKYTKGHSKRVAEYSKLLGIKAGLNEKEIDRLYYLAILHDIGKIGVPDSILKKADKLTNEEFDTIKKHPETGAVILNNISSFENGPLIVESHHERYDGTGYPNGLKGENIPYFSRIISIADSYDAMKSKRIYRRPLTPEYIRNEIVRNYGLQFDPELAPLFVELIDDGSLDKID